MAYKSDLHIYYTTERGTKVRGYRICEGSYVVETHSESARHGADEGEYTWDVPIGFVRRNPLTRFTERYSLLTRENYPTRGATTGVRELAEAYDRAVLKERIADSV